eukprot:TRINITY_DN10330_c0_g1_i1.p1 TRINITY_DN10330_c0_g1~~TRINITY_DN10330_c0_g1_i1.p1  ORF type:complete len:264 (-),score=52.58 TRINITY_DN10330_c0_g1_i1:299-1090(-)
MEIPSRYVPEAFAEWGQVLYDWQTQCSMIAKQDGLKYTLRKLLPTVGCEADAIAFVEEEKHILRSSQPGQDKTVLQNGSYSSGPPKISDEDKKFTLQHCLITGEKTRVRFFHNFTRPNPDQKWRLLNLEVIKEQFEQPYHGKMDLGGCGGGMPQFSNKERLNEKKLQGQWKKGVGVGMGFEYNADLGYHVIGGVDDEKWSGDASQGDVICLPEDMWSRVYFSEIGIEIESGVYLTDDTRVVGRRIFQDNFMVRDFQGVEELAQ